MKTYVMALDAGTTSNRAMIFDRDGAMVGVAQRELTQMYPRPGWVEHDPMEIWGTLSGVMREVLEKEAISPGQIAAIGITNQRETTVVWDRDTGAPIAPAIVWQCRRSAPICDALKRQGYEEMIYEKTGLKVDAYFSATKILWILENVPGAREKAEAGKLLFGTVDTWILYHLTRGKAHRTDVSNASRTMLFNIHTLDWDEELLDLMKIPRSMLPEVLDSSADFGRTDRHTFGGAQIPITGIAGDQQAALFGQAAFEEGMVKNTYGTGCFLLMNTGKKPISSRHGLLSTIAWGLEGEVTYALEGSVFNAGSAIQWLRDELRLLYDAPMSEYYANKVESTEGVYVVPSFTGLGAPYWDMYSRGGIFGLTRGTKREHIVRATLESLAYQSRDVLDAMQKDAAIPLKSIRVNGGATANDFLMQFQADIIDTPVERPQMIESTALGAAYLAGLRVGYWKDLQEIATSYRCEHLFSPQMDPQERQRRYHYWKKAVQRTMDWLEDES